MTSDQIAKTLMWQDTQLGRIETICRLIANDSQLQLSKDALFEIRQYIIQKVKEEQCQLQKDKVSGLLNITRKN